MQKSEFGLQNANLASCGADAAESPGRAFARILVMMIVVGGFAETCPVYAQQVERDEVTAKEQPKEDEKVRPTINLGVFNVKDLRPTSNETAKVAFAIHLALDPSVDPLTVRQLEHWQHRLRDQVIIAIRLSETEDFVEPDLTRFRRIVLLRTNLALRSKLVSGVLLTEFTFTTN